MDAPYDFTTASAAAVGFFIAVSSVSLAIGFVLERRLPHRRIWALPLDRGQYRHELIGNVVFIAVASVAAGLGLSSGLLRIATGSWSRGLLTFLTLALGFQVYYYFLHRAMHHRALVRFHRWHHISRVTTPLSGQSMSPVEAALWMVGYVGLPILFSQIAPISLGGAIGYVGYNVFGNIVGHANVELVPRSRLLHWKTLLSNTFIYHALHHARWTGHYGFAAALMDRLCGSEWADWPELHAQVVAGQPLTDLRQRGTMPSAP